MSHRGIIASAVLASGLLVLGQGGGADAAIVCDGNFQVVNGTAIGTPYCRELTLAKVARSYGFTVTLEAVRYSESTRSQLCHAIGYDNRVQDICSPYLNYGGGRFQR
jgi:hypothetical protein